MGAEGQALSHGHGGGGERLQVFLQRLQVLDQLTINTLHLDKEVVGAFVHLFHASIDLKRRNECLCKGERKTGVGSPGASLIHFLNFENFFVVKLFSNSLKWAKQISKKFNHSVSVAYLVLQSVRSKAIRAAESRCYLGSDFGHGQIGD